MKVFSTFDGRPAAQNTTRKMKKSSSNKIERVKKEKPPRKNYSASQIKARLNNHLEKSNKTSKTSETKAFVTHDEMRKKTEDAIGKAKELGAMSNNKPDSEETRSKLKDSLSTGSFAFSDKERQVLSEILGS
jgi:hypothetical protein